MVHTEKIVTPSGIEVFVAGPSKDKGALPALFYFALSGIQSLTLDPFNQPVVHLQKEPMRVFSMSLPGHGQGHDPALAIAHWAEHMDSHGDIIEEFVSSVIQSIDFLIDEGWIDPSAIAVAGLSRGGFVASHVAAVDDRVNTLLAWAPLTDLTVTKEFSHLGDSEIYKLEPLADKLVHKAIRLYIGNHDTRVGTDACFHFVQSVVKACGQKHIRSPKVELIISPSIGHKGHGTPPHIFSAGADWIKEQLFQHLKPPKKS